MGQFYDTDLGVSTATAAEMNECAVNRAGVWGSIGYGYAMRGSLPSERHGYALKWVDTRGMGNYGKLVLTGVSRTAREMLRQGRIALYARELNISAYEASRLDRAATGIYRGRELSVLAAAVSTAADAAWETYPGQGNGVRRWLGLDASHLAALSELSVPRLDAVHEIVMRLRGSEK